MRGPAAVARPLAVGVIAVAALALIAHAAAAQGGGHLSLLSGIWLALGRDLADGIFYRDLITDAGYGGTRYFPLFFIVIAAFMKAGAGVVTAGWLTSAVASSVLVAGMFRLVRAIGGSRLQAGIFAAAAIAPYFVQQTLFEVRADVLAAALNVWGLAFVLPEWGRHPDRRAQPAWGAICFTLALATKVTSVAIPLVLVLAMILTGRRKLALGVLWRLMLGAALFLLAVSSASDGRAITSWRTTMFAGSDAGTMLQTLLAGDVLRLVAYSRLLIVLFAATVLALAAAALLATRTSAGRASVRGPADNRGLADDPGPADTRGSVLVPFALFAAASLSTLVALSSPGTVPSNHMVEWIEICLIVLALLACTRPAMTRGVAIFTCVFVLWASAQDVRAARGLLLTRAAEGGAAQALVTQVAAAPGPVLSESAMWPLLAGRRAYLLDPFALRVVMQARPDVERDLLDKIDQHAFSFVIFEVDPTTDAGRGFYEHVNFGWVVTGRVLERYRFAGHPRPDVYLYVPRD